MSRHMIAARPRLSVRLPFALAAILLSLALACSGCCGGCCRTMIGPPSGGSGNSSSSGGIQSAPNSGSVASLVKNQVGPFHLVGTAPVTRLGYNLRPGVIDSIGALYAGPGGALNQIILAYSSAQEANARMDVVYTTIARECPGKRLMRSNVKNANGVTIGKEVVCDRDPQHVYWSNGRILTFVTASHPQALRFYHASSY